MMRTTLLILTSAVLTVGLVACGAETTSTPPGPDQAHDESAHEGHDHSEGPHGGHVVVLGDHTAHLEITHGDGDELIVYALDADMKPAAFDEAPTLNLLTDEGSLSVEGVAVADGGWQFAHDALMDHDVAGRFRLKLAGKTYNSEYSACDHGHEHADCEHGAHDGTVAAFHGADGKPGGTLELKLHDDKGDLELWLVMDESLDLPFDAPLDTKIQVVFHDHGDRTVHLAVRDTKQNADEDGTPNIRGGQTNYFIFPGDTEADAGWLVGADFKSKVVVSFAKDGVTYTSDVFELEPHTHHDHDHGHDDGDGHDDHDEGHEDDHHEGHE